MAGKCVEAGSEATASVTAGRSEIVVLEMNDEPPAVESENRTLKLEKCCFHSVTLNKC